MRTLIADDDFSSRKLLQAILQPYCECHLVGNGREALDAFEHAYVDGSPYDLVFLDIMMPKMDGQQVLKGIRAFEEGKGVLGSRGIKIIMTTVLKDSKNVMEAFRSQCESYIVKPVDSRKLLKEIRAFGLIETDGALVD